MPGFTKWSLSLRFPHQNSKPSVAEFKIYFLKVSRANVIVFESIKRDSIQYLYAVIHIKHTRYFTCNSRAHLRTIMHNYYVVPLLGITKCKVNTTADHEGPDEE
jgi:hypothetical protein